MIDIEELLAAHLARDAARAMPRHDLDAVLREGVVVRLREPTRQPVSPRWRGRIAAVVAVGGLATASVIALRSDSPVATTVPPEATASATCQVFISPDARTEVIAGIGERLRQRPEVINLQFVSQQQAYDEFLRIFAGKEITSSVTADMLPTKWTFDLDPDTAANQQAITTELIKDPAVRQAHCTQSTSFTVTPSTCADTGPAIVTTPNVMGRPLPSAIAIMRQAGLTVLGNGVSGGDPIDANAIVRVQLPSAGDQVPLGSCVGFRTGR